MSEKVSVSHCTTENPSTFRQSAQNVGIFVHFPGTTLAICLQVQKKILFYIGHIIFVAPLDSVEYCAILEMDGVFNREGKRQGHSVQGVKGDIRSA